jgi:WD40 repeat protein/energy-coupling factor transporter ATP-binding protein EcfA2
MPKRKTKSAEQVSIATGDIRDVSGKVTIAGGDIYEGYTVEQVSLLLKEITTNYRRKPFDGRCPYKGLEVFEEEDADLFFGRERLVEDLVSRVKESRTVFITGPSGSGKSSLVRAGLIHALKDGAIKGSDRWLYETMKPGREPIQELSLAFSRLKGPELTDYFLAHANEPDVLHRCAESVLSGRKDQRFVLFVDQFEEVFTQIGQEEERQAFINMLSQAGIVENGRVIVLFAMRSDFVSNCASYPALNELLSQEFRQIGAMRPEELVSAIALPAKQVGLPIEEELIARIINDMKGEPGALPLMQFALKDLFDAQQSQGGVIELTLADYLKHGGIQKSLERHADASLAALDEEGQTLARSIFSGLIEIGRGTVDTKRTALFDELVPANASSWDVLAIVQKLADARLIITDEQAGKDTVTISHEKLIEAWPWLKKLVNENRDIIALQNEIASNAKEWEDHQRDLSYLYTGARLANAREQLEARKLALSGLAQEFIEAGVKAHTEELEAARQRANQLRRRSIYLTAALVGALIAVGIAIFFSLQSRQQAKIALSRQLAAQSVNLRSKNFLLSMLLGAQAYRTNANVQTQAALLENFQEHPQLVRYLDASVAAVTSVAFSPDGSVLATGTCKEQRGDLFRLGKECTQGEIVLWDAKTWKPIGQPLEGMEDSVSALSFDPTGKILVWGDRDGTIISWDVRTRQRIGQPLEEQLGAVTRLDFNVDGKILAAISAYNSITIWNVEDRRLIGQFPGGRQNADDYVSVIHATLGIDGNMITVAYEDGTVIPWNVEAGQPIIQPLRGHDGPIASAAHSADRRMLALGGADGTITLWNVETRQVAGQLLDGHIDPVENLSFNQDGKMLASSGADGMIVLWDVESLRPLGQPLKGHVKKVESLAFSIDSKILASAGADGMTILWSTENRQPIRQSLKVNNELRSLVFSPDGKLMASGGRSDDLHIFDVETAQAIGEPLTEARGYIYSVEFSPDGKLLASGGGSLGTRGDINVWDVQTRKLISQQMIESERGFVYDISFSPDGKRLATGQEDGIVHLWDVENLRLIDQLPRESRGPGAVYEVAFSPDGRTLVAGYDRRTIILWNMENGQPIVQLREPLQDPVSSLAFHPDGKILASGSYDGTVILWDLETFRPIGQPLREHTSIVSDMGFSPDGKTLASAGYDRDIILWDVQTLQPVGHLLPERRWLSTVAFHPGGTMLASGSSGVINLWDLDPGSWLDKSCQRAGRNFTRAEWAQYFPGEEYPTKQENSTCPEWSLEPEPIMATSAPNLSPTP